MAAIALLAAYLLVADAEGWPKQPDDAREAIACHAEFLATIDPWSNEPVARISEAAFTACHAFWLKASFDYVFENGTLGLPLTEAVQAQMNDYRAAAIKFTADEVLRLRKKL